MSAQSSGEIIHVVALGDTWTALAHRYGSSPAELVAQAEGMNPHRQPAIGSTLQIAASEERSGRLLRPSTGGLLELAARHGRNPWAIARQNNLSHPYVPPLYTAVFLPGGSVPPRDLPPGFKHLALSSESATPGEALGLRGRLSASGFLHVSLEGESFLVTERGGRMVAVGATSAFFPPGQPLLSIQVAGQPLWEQPIVFGEGQWTWEQVTFNDTAVLDPDEIRRERERLQEVWDTVTPQAFWQGDFQLPIADYVEITSLYGARRSVNGGPYNTYHEGADFSAYGGSEVRAPAAGQVALAETLSIRGGSVILDHGLGLHSGYYHLSAVHVSPGQSVEKGDLIGEVGSTGRSTGNHLHWDLLAGRTWIDPLQFTESDLPSWLSAGWIREPSEVSLSPG